MGRRCAWLTSKGRRCAIPVGDDYLLCHVHNPDGIYQKQMRGEIPMPDGSFRKPRKAGGRRGRVMSEEEIAAADAADDSGEPISVMGDVERSRLLDADVDEMRLELSRLRVAALRADGLVASLRKELARAEMQNGILRAENVRLSAKAGEVAGSTSRRNEAVLVRGEWIC